MIFGDETCITPRHNCCNWCHKNCDCGGDGPCSEPLPVFDKPPVEETYTGPIRTVTDEDRNYLRAALFELKLSLGRQTKVSLFDNSGAISHGFTDKVSIYFKCSRECGGEEEGGKLMLKALAMLTLLATSTLLIILSNVSEEACIDI